MIKREKEMPPVVKIMPKQVLNPSIPVNNNVRTIDWESHAGKFGWEFIDQTPLPYIYRGGRKYCSATMFSLKMLSKFENKLNNEVHTCFKILSYPMTQAEARLFEEINIFHCNGFIGGHSFKTGDVMLLLEDVKELYEFIDSCYNVLVEKNYNFNGTSRFGFVKIGEESMVPYVNPGGTLYVPLFYFEGDNNSLSSKFVSVHTWNLAYLKFCFKLQGIKPQLYEGNSCKVVKLTDLQQFFPVNTQFRFDWPKYDGKKFLNNLSTPNNAVSVKNQENKDYKTMILPFFGKNVRCVNLRSREFTTLAITLRELHTLFFFSVSKDVFFMAVRRCKVHLYPPNKHHIYALYHSTLKTVEFVDFLILVKDVSEYIVDIKKYCGV